MSGRPRAVVIGTTSLDLIATADDDATASTAAGNSGSNIAIRLAALGWDASLVALVGDDALAPAVRADLTAWGVDVTGVVSRPDYRTPRVFHVVAGGSSHLLFTCPRCGRPRGHTLDLPHPDELPAPAWAAIEGADAIVVDIAQPLAVEAVSRSHARLVWYEQSLAEATPAQMRDMAAVADVVKVSSDDLYHYRPSEGVHGPRLRIVSRGSRGVEMYRPDALGWVSSGLHEGPRLDAVIDTIGAGDAFTAVAVAGMGRGQGEDEWRTAALVAAARACAAVGARGDMIDHAEAPAARKASAIAFQCAQCDAGES